MNPKVSVIVPVYNVEEYLAPCLESILGQTLAEIEVICVEAGSTDGSPAILKGFEEKDSRVKAVYSPTRLDAGAARNIGLKLARGEYLSFLDSDDLFRPSMLEESWARAKAQGADVVIFYASQLDMRTGETTFMPWSMRAEYCPAAPAFSPRAIAPFLFNLFQNWTWNKLFRAEFIKEKGIVFQSIARTNDMAFTCQALAQAERITLLKKAFPVYRVGTGTSLQSTNDRSPAAFWAAYKETKRRLEEAGVYELYKQSFLNAVVSGMMYNLDSLKSDAAYREVSGLIKAEGDAVFGLLAHPRHYYLNRNKYDAYRRLLAGEENPPSQKAAARPGAAAGVKKQLSAFTRSRPFFRLHSALIRLHIIRY
ncbi:MAG: glycosyltransferase family 2 protein [Oscillospiraceae bacterium]|nr:glycosyltransferase family 2 protein [Oscillospiraceae bacterium]